MEDREAEPRIENRGSRIARAEGRRGAIVYLRSFILEAFLAVTLVTWGLSAVESHGQTTKVLVSAPAKSLTWFPAFFAKEKGFYRDEGLDVDFVVMGPQLALQALVAGDVGYTTALGSTMRGAARGLPIRVVITICEKPHFALIARPGINSVAALKGKVLGVSSYGASSYTMARAMLQHFKLDPSQDVKILAVGGGTNRLAALKAGSIDATLMEFPYNLMLEKEGFTRILFVGDLVPSPIAGFGATVERIQKRPDEIRRMVRATLRATKYVKSHREESAKSIAKWTGMETALAEGSYDLAAGTWSNSGIPDAGALNAAMLDVARELKLEAPPEPSKIFDWSFVKEK
jgi:NitT/TauT family transport system substrate-binding protein